MSDRSHRLTLRDGADVVVRPIAPTDRDALLAGFERLSFVAVLLAQNRDIWPAGRDR